MDSSSEADKQPSTTSSVGAGASRPLTDLLDEGTLDAVEQERRALVRLHELLTAAEFDAALIRQARDIAAHVDEIFLLVIVGEVKAGKSSFINALVGQKVCKEGAIPTTDKVHILRHGETTRERLIEEFLVEEFHPFEQLRGLNIVDTPGTNSVISRHGEIAEEFIPRCDMVLFTTSADRPFTETEREFLDLIAKGWARKIVFVLTKADIKSDDELKEIIDYVSDNCVRFLDFKPLIFPVSSKLAYQAKQDNDVAAFEKSGFGALEDYLFGQLHQHERIKIKLQSPVNAGLKLCDQTKESLAAQLEMVKRDTAVSDTISKQLEQSEDDLAQGADRYLLELDNVLYELEKRARDWIDDNVRLGNLGMIRSSTRFRDAFTANVLKDYEAKLEDVLHRSVDWFTKRNLKVWEDTLGYFSASVDQKKLEGKVIGKIQPHFEYNRDELFERIRTSAREGIREFDQEGQVRKLLGSIGSALRASLGISAVGLGGGAVAVLLGGVWVDVTGIAAGIAVLGLSTLVLPARRGGLKRGISKSLSDLRETLRTSLRSHLEGEAQAAVERVREVLKPYMDYCDRSRTSLAKQIDESDAIRTELLEVRQVFEAALKKLGEGPHQGQASGV